MIRHAALFGICSGWLLPAFLTESAELTEGEMDGSDGSCNVVIDREGVLDQFSRVVPATNQHDDMSIVWQSGEAIWARQFSKSCDQRNASNTLVNSTEGFWKSESDGLADAAVLESPAGETVVAWVSDGDLWIRVMSLSTGRFQPAVQVNAPSAEFRSRREVQIKSRPDSNDFVVVWTSWQQDGDGWGVFARPFKPDSSGVHAPDGPEKQVTASWRAFQYHPQLQWCRSSLWALWANGSGVPCGFSENQCDNGPFVRNLSGWLVETPTPHDPWPEISVEGSRPLATAHTCLANSDDSKVLWLSDGKKGLMFNSKKIQGGGLSSASLGSPLAPFDVWNKLSPFMPADTPAALLSGRRLDTPSLGQQRANLTASGAVGPTGMMLLADQTHAVVITDGRVIRAQMVQHQQEEIKVFPLRTLATGLVNVKMLWDSSGDAALVLCGVREAGDRPSTHGPQFVCMRRPRVWLEEGDDLDVLGKGVTMVMSMGMMLMMAFCLYRHCSAAARARGRPGLVRRSAARPSPQLRELRSQLERIRLETADQEAQEVESGPPSAVAPQPSTPSEAEAELGRACGDEPVRQPASCEINAEGPQPVHRDTSVANRAPGNECSICHNDIAVRVALRPCGHTACRECVTRVVEINQRCHICRGSISGVQLVYI